MSELVEVQRLRQMLKAARSLLRELAIACARVEEELDRAKAARLEEELDRAQAAQSAQPKEAQHGHGEADRQYAVVA
jgi:Sec-independent protein translocase protein TatA